MWQSSRASYRTQTPNTVTPVSLISMAQVPRNRLAPRAQGDSVHGTELSDGTAPTHLEGGRGEGEGEGDKEIRRERG